MFFGVLRGLSITPKKGFFSNCHSFWNTTNTSLWKFESKIIQSRPLIEDLRICLVFFPTLRKVSSSSEAEAAVHHSRFMRPVTREVRAWLKQTSLRYFIWWLKFTASLVCLSLKAEQANFEVLQRLSMPCLSFLMLGLNSAAQSSIESISWLGFGTSGI